MQEEEVIYELRTPFEYAYKGDYRTAKFITLSPPTVSNMALIARLKQGFMQAMAGDDSKRNSGQQPAGDSDDDSGIDSLTGDMVMALISMSKVDYAGYMETVKAVFTGGRPSAVSDVAKVDGEEPLNSTLLDKMTASDLESMAGKFIHTFIVTSALRTMQM